MAPLFVCCGLKTSLAHPEGEFCVAHRTDVSPGEKRSRSFSSFIRACLSPAPDFLAPLAWEARSRRFGHLRNTRLPIAQDSSSIRTLQAQESFSRFCARPGYLCIFLPQNVGIYN